MREQQGFFSFPHMMEVAAPEGNNELDGEPNLTKTGDSTDPLSHLYRLGGEGAHLPHTKQQGFLYSEEVLSGHRSPQIIGGVLTRRDGPVTRVTESFYLIEGQYCLTRLPKKRFQIIAIMGLVNVVGVHLLLYSQFVASFFVERVGWLPWLAGGCLQALQVYSLAFFALPLLRAAVLSVLNMQVSGRVYMFCC